ncbi:hypothetical protein B0H11DRAFT_1907492 [Mycena galericulata]|nr:hypothetical protein B0H11DRAFT_1907492 [Mycena galericulata]
MVGQWILSWILQFLGSVLEAGGLCRSLKISGGSAVKRTKAPRWFAPLLLRASEGERLSPSALAPESSARRLGVPSPIALKVAPPNSPNVASSEPQTQTSRVAIKHLDIASERRDDDNQRHRRLDGVKVPLENEKT